MDKELEGMQLLGLFDVYRECYKFILSKKKIFTQITLTLILPLSIIHLINNELFGAFSSEILQQPQGMSETPHPQGTPQYHELSEGSTPTLSGFRLVHFILNLIFSVLSTSAVVYTIASIYTAREVTFSMVMNVVPKLWKRVMVTFLCNYVPFIVYNFIAGAVVMIWALITGLRSSWISTATIISIGILYLVGFVYLTALWQLASVVSVLEDSYGYQAMLKSEKLIKGKMGLSILIFLKLNVSSFLIQLMFTKVVVQGCWTLNSVYRTAFGILCLLLLSHVSLFGLVFQCVLYLVCKSYHHENIDKSALSDHLKVYEGQYEAFMDNDVPLEQCNV